MVEELLTWFERNQRELPWRREPRDPYRVWVSEIMLQQTQVATVIPYFNRWCEQFPSIGHLARAPLSRVLKAWEGLGYYRRAHHIHRAANVLAADHGGRLPEDSKALLKLPGIGPYTAAAIASLCFGEDILAVDGNIKRVSARLFTIEGEVSHAAVKRCLGPLVPRGKAGRFNEALMELGATVCNPRDPGCPDCPLSTNCRALEQGRVDELPFSKQRRRVPHVRAAALILVKKRKIYLKQRGKEGMLGGLWGFPLLKEPPDPPAGSPVLPDVQHAYSHFTITATPWVIEEPFPVYGDEADETEGAFVTPQATGKLALSTLDRKILKRWLESLEPRKKHP
jgi:A/G-specific adenine glycosylase